MIKTLKIFLTITLVISMLAIASGCKNKQSSSSKPEESSQFTDSLQTSEITNNSSSSVATGSSESTSKTENTSSSDSPTEEYANDYHSRPDFSDYTSSSVADTSSDSASSKVVSSNTAISTSSQMKYAKKAVSVVLDAIKGGDFETAQNNITGNQPEQEDLGFDDATMAKIKRIFAELDYKIVSAKRTDSTQYAVTVKISAVNFKKVYSAYVKTASEIAHNSPNLTPEQINAKIDKAFNNALKDGKKELVEKTVKLTVVGHGKNWQLQYSTDFSKACLGGIDKVADALK